MVGVGCSLHIVGQGQVVVNAAMGFLPSVPVHGFVGELLGAAGEEAVFLPGRQQATVGGVRCSELPVGSAGGGCRLAAWKR